MNLLVLTSRFPHAEDSISSSFVKSQIDCMKDFFEKIYVISLNPFIPNILSEFPFMNPRWSRDALASDYGYDNIEVYFAKYVSLPFDFWRKNIGDIALEATRKVIKNKNISFDLIHAHFTWPCGHVGCKIKNKYNVPLIITGHGYDVYDLPFRDIKWNTTIRRILIGSDHIITVSKKNYDKLMQLDSTTDKISIIPNGYDSSLFRQLSKERVRKKLNLPKDKKIILSVGILDLVKGHEYLVKALDIIVQQEKNVLCIIVGSGSQERSLKKMISNLNLGDHIKLVGSKPHDEIPLWMNACDVFILPSLSESFGIVQIEAMACGKPIVATLNGGSEEIIINEKLGILVEPKDIDELAKAILMALSNKWDSMYIIEYAKLFTWEKIAARVKDVYEIALKPI